MHATVCFALFVRLVSSNHQTCHRSRLRFLILPLHVILLLKQISSNLRLLQRLEISFCALNQQLSSQFTYAVSIRVFRAISIGLHTSERPTLLQMIDPFPVITLPQLVPHQTCHHTLHPLLSYNRILRCLQSACVGVVDAVEAGWNGGLLGEEEGRFGGRHCVGRGARRRNLW